MALFSRFFAASKTESVAVIDIGSGSIGAGYVVLKKDSAQYSATPAVCHLHDGEVRPQKEDIAGTLRDVLRLLIAKGAVDLREETGQGSVSRVVVSIASPWQETRIRKVHLEQEKPFVFTHSLLRSLVEKDAEVAEGKVSTGESVIATLLNGYETQKPFGKHAHLAQAVILSESVDQDLVSLVQNVVGELFHLHTVLFSAFPPLAYTVFRDSYPHENDYLLLDIAGTSTDITLVKQKLLTALASFPLGVQALEGVPETPADVGSGPATGSVSIHRIVDGLPTKGSTEAKQAWLQKLQESLKAFASEQALPRTIFLLSDEREQEFLKETLNDPTLRSLWLSTAPLSIIPVVPSQFLPQVRLTHAARGDIFLMLLALFLRKDIENM